MFLFTSCFVLVCILCFVICVLVLALGLFTPTKRTILRFHVNRCFVIFEFDLYCFIDNNMQRETMNFLNDIHIVLSEIKKNFRSVCEFN